MKNVLPFLVLTLTLTFCSQPEKEMATTAVASRVSDTDTLPGAVAAQSIGAYGAYRNHLDSTLVATNNARDTTLQVLGFKLPKDEITAMAERIKASNQDSVYAMLAIRLDANNKPYTTLIFQEYTGQPGNPWSYYDYSRPCPPNCPK